MLLLVLIISEIVAQSVLAYVGAQRGLPGKVIVCRRRADCIQNAFLVGSFAVRYISIWLQLISLQITLALVSIWPISWLYTTKRNSSQKLDHSVVAP